MLLICNFVGIKTSVRPCIVCNTGFKPNVPSRFSEAGRWAQHPAPILDNQSWSRAYSSPLFLFLCRKELIQAYEAGTRYLEVPTRKLKPSQTCSGCGERQKKALHQRTHECPCGTRLSRDENAARVILNWALDSIKGRGSALCGEIALAVSAKHETPAIA